MDLDEYQDEIGGISLYQVIVIISVSFLSFGTSITSQASIFISAVPDYRCSIPIIDDDPHQCNLTEQEIKNLTTPIDADREYTTCSSYAYNMTTCTGICNLTCLQSNHEGDTMTCIHGYEYDDTWYGETTTSQFDLVCDRRYLDTIAQTLLFVGFFLGSLVIGPLCDWFGRKNAILIVLTGFIGVSVGCSFSQSYEAFVVTRLFAGGFNIANYIAVFTYVNEISNTKRRTEAAVWVNLSSAFGHTIYPGIAYFLRNWHYIQLTIALIPAPIYIMYFFIPETPRWLLANGKNEEAKKVISKYAKSKGKELTDGDWNLIIKTENEKIASHQTEKETAEKVRVWDLFRRPLMRILCFNIMFSWFTVSMVFYGLALNGGNLAGDPYVNTTLNAVVEIGAYICLYFAYIVGRRIILTGSFILAGLFCIGSMLFDIYSYGSNGFLTASTVFAIAGKFFASLAFAVIYSVTSEIFPTIARVTGVSVGSMAARVGGMLSPLVLQQQDTIPWFTQTLFGVLSVIAGAFSLLYPETAKTDFISTMDEAEDYYRENMAILKLLNRKQRLKKTDEKKYSDNTGMNEKQKKHDSKLAFVNAGMKDDEDFKEFTAL